MQQPRLLPEGLAHNVSGGVRRQAERHPDVAGLEGAQDAGSLDVAHRVVLPVCCGSARLSFSESRAALAMSLHEEVANAARVSLFSLPFGLTLGYTDVYTYGENQTRTSFCCVPIYTVCEALAETSLHFSYIRYIPHHVSLLACAAGPTPCGLAFSLSRRLATLLPLTCARRPARPTAPGKASCARGAGRSDET